MTIRENVSTSAGDFVCYRESYEAVHEGAVRSLKRRLGAVAARGGFRGTADGNSIYEFTFTRRDGSVIQSVTLWVRN